MADAALRLFQAHLGQGLPHSLSERRTRCIKHAPELQPTKLLLHDAPDELDAVELGVVRDVPDDRKLQDLGVPDGCVGSMDRRIVEQQRLRPRTNGVSEVGQKISE